MVGIERERVERVARMYRTCQDASRALGIAPGSFSRLCRKFEIDSPRTRRRRYQQNRYEVGEGDDV